MRLNKQALRVSLRRHPVVHRLTVLARENGIFVKPEGVQGVQHYGHRASVGGDWHKHGKFQFNYMKIQGLTPFDVFLDIGCGSLRGGLHFLPYLEAGNYLGMEKEAALLTAGIEHEAGAELVAQKKPELVVSDAFEFHKFTKRPVYAFAGSVFSHLTAADITLCLRNLRAQAHPDCRFIATYFETARPRKNYSRSHAHYSFYYTRDEMAEMGRANGWDAECLGDWEHPGVVTQRVMRFSAM